MTRGQAGSGVKCRASVRAAFGLRHRLALAGFRRLEEFTWIGAGFWGVAGYGAK